MNATTLTSCALLSVLSLASLSPSSAAPLQSSSPIVDSASVVIRYDPEAVFLTDELVAPLCRREVRLTDDSVAGPVGELVIDPMHSNELQPKGVFVGRARVTWADGVNLTTERREKIFDDGLEQLRKALANRLVAPRQVDYWHCISTDLAPVGYWGLPAMTGTLLP